MALRHHLWIVPAVMLAAAPAHAATITVEGFDSAAITAAIERAEPGDVVMLPAGVYSITEAVRPTTGIALRGAGQDETILRFTGDTPSHMMVISGAEGVEVSHLTLDGAENPNAHQGLTAGNSRRLNIHHITIRDLVRTDTFGPHGIRFSGVDPTRERGVTDSVIADCRLENIGVGASFGSAIRLSWGSSRNQVLRCTIHNTGRGGIFGDNGSTDLVIRGNTVTGSGGTRLGIEVWGGCDRSVIEDNVIDHWLSIGGADWVALRRNVISAQTGEYAGYGIEAIGSYLVITDNVVDDGQAIGLSVSSRQPKEYVFYGHNVFRSMTQWGAQLQGEEGGIARQYLYRCEFRDTTVERGRVPYPTHEGHGFRINGNTRHLVLEECVIGDNARLGVQVHGPNVDFLSFVRTAITGNGGAASSGMPEYTALEWEDCVVEGNARDTLPEARPFPAPPPDADFEMPAQAVVGEAVTFRNLSTAAEGELDRALWDLDDGPPVVGDEVTHTYDRPGEYRVTMIVWDAAGRGARAEKELRVVAHD